MPQGHREEHLQYYREHNQAVAEHFRDRPMKLLAVCWENGPCAQELADSLGLEFVEIPPQQVNRSSRVVYNGNKLYLTHADSACHQTWWHAKRHARHVLRALRHRLSPNTS